MMGVSARSAKTLDFILDEDWLIAYYICIYGIHLKHHQLPVRWLDAFGLGYGSTDEVGIFLKTDKAV